MSKSLHFVGPPVKRLAFGRSAGLAAAAAAIFITGIVSFVVICDFVQTRDSLSVKFQGKSYAAWISSDRTGYHLHMRGPNHRSSDGLIIAHDDLGNQSADCRVEWNQDKQEIVGTVGKFRKTVKLP